MKLLVKPQPTAQQIAAYSERLLAENNPMDSRVTVDAIDPVTRSGLAFFAGSSGQTIEEYCCEAILSKLEVDECDTREGDGHFSQPEK